MATSSGPVSSAPTPREFLDSLRNGALATPTEIVGMVRASEEDDGDLQFSLDCASWVSIPIDLVEHAVSLGPTPCKDHSHHTARIRLKEPQSEEARVFARLLGAFANTSAMPGITPRMGDPWAIRCRKDCYHQYFPHDPTGLRLCLQGCEP
jgi:hypothetical protein